MRKTLALIAVSMVIAALVGCQQSTAGPTTSPGVTSSPPPTSTSLPADTSTPVPSPTAISTSTVPAPTPSVTVSPPFDTGELAARVEGLAAQGQFSGAALIANEDGVLWEFAGGLADREANLPNQVDTLFNLGSMNKMFTAVAIMQLMEQGRLALNDTIAQHLPDYPNRTVADEVTIQQLLEHTSGLGDVFTSEFMANPNGYRSNEDFLPLFVDQPLLFTPGQEFSYSNAGFVVLGLIIEAVSGQDYYDYVRQNIFEPSGMTRTDSYFVDEAVPNMAIGYTHRDFYGNDTGVLAPNSALMPGRGFAAGGGYSTVGDLLLFRNALLGYRLLSPETTDLLITGRVQFADNIRYAYGFMDVLNSQHQRMVGHTGGAPGICSFMYTYLASGYTVVMLTNSDDDCRAVLGSLRN